MRFLTSCPSTTARCEMASPVRPRRLHTVLRALPQPLAASVVRVAAGQLAASLSTIRRRAPGLSPLAVDLSPAAVLCFALPPTDPIAVDLELTIESVMRAGGALCHFACLTAACRVCSPACGPLVCPRVAGCPEHCRTACAGAVLGAPNSRTGSAA